MPLRASSKTLLIVDDERDFRDALETALAAEGFAVLKAGTAAEGIVVAVALDPDVVLLDEQLPDRRGSEVLTELRQRGFGRPIVVLSGAPDLLPHPGANRHLRKPVDFDELCSVLKTLTAEGPSP